MNIEILKIDITQLHIDAIVNAANNAMCGGGGVDGAIHRKAGKELLIECLTLKGCKTGEAKLTNGYNLPSKYIIHTVGPVWYGGHKNEESLLASCYQETLKIANEKGFKTIAFPAISCGAYRFPIEKACEIAIKEVSSFEHKTLEKVIFACFETKLERALHKSLQKI